MLVVSGTDAFFIVWGRPASDDGFTGVAPGSETPQSTEDPMSRLRDAAAVPLVLTGAAALAAGTRDRMAKGKGEPHSGRPLASAEALKRPD